MGTSVQVPHCPVSIRKGETRRDTPCFLLLFKNSSHPRPQLTYSSTSRAYSCVLLKQPHPRLRPGRVLVLSCPVLSLSVGLRSGFPHCDLISVSFLFLDFIDWLIAPEQPRTCINTTNSLRTSGHIQFSILTARYFFGRLSIHTYQPRQTASHAGVALSAQNTTVTISSSTST